MPESRSSRSPRPQLAHVAKAAKVSLSTASACLRDVPGPSEETRKRVKAAATRLGYRTNLQAKALRAGQLQTVALIFDPLILEPHPRAPQTFWQRFVNSILKTLGDEDIALLVVAADSIDSLQGAAIDAVILSALPDEAAASERVGFGIPVVATGVPRVGVSASCFASHDVASMHRDALDILGKGGSVRPALVRQIGVEHVLHDVTEYNRWCHERGIEPLLLSLDDVWEADEAIDLVGEAIADGADGFLVRNGDTQIVLAGIKQAGKSVPRDVQVVAQAEGLIEALTSPTVTTVSLQGWKSGRLVAEEVIRQIKDPTLVNIRDPRSLRLPYEVTARESTR